MATRIFGNSNRNFSSNGKHLDTTQLSVEPSPQYGVFQVESSKSLERRDVGF